MRMSRRPASRTRSSWNGSRPANVNFTENPANWRPCWRNYTHTMTPRKEATMKRSKKSKKEQVRERAKRYEFTEIIKEAMSQGIIMEQMYGHEKDTHKMLDNEDPLKLVTFVLESIDDLREDGKMFGNPNYGTKTIH